MELKDLISRFRNGLDLTHTNPTSSSSEPVPRVGSWNVGQAKRIYHPLPPHCIRLVRLEPADKPDAQIVLYTEVTGLQYPPAFEALSYVWGKRDPLVHIKYNGLNFHITPNLALALRQLRRPFKEGARILWVDAVCINQDDDAERSAQVMKMKDIYSKAKCVLIWLGKVENNDYLFAAAGKQISALAKYLRNGSQTPTPSLHQISAILKMPDNKITYEFRQWIENQRHWQFIQTILMSSWFTRVWIIQEFAQAQDIKILMGQNVLPSFDLFLCALYVRKNHYNLAPPEAERLDHIIRIYNMRFKNHLLPQIEATSMFQATNPRDKIYAVIGLPSVEQDRDFEARSLLRPDYTKDTWEVYGNVVRHFISLPRERVYHSLGAEPVGGHKYGEGVLDILRPPERHGLLSDEDKEVTAKHWPSWVPRWDLIDENYRHPPGIWAMNPKFLWRPAGDLHVRYLPPKNESDKKTLELRGAKIGAVDAIFDHVLLPCTITQRNSKGFVKKLLRHIEEHFSFDLNQTSTIYRGPGSLKADFAEVITAGSLTELTPAESTSSMETTIRSVVGIEGQILQEWLGSPAGSNSSSEYLANKPKRSATGDSKGSSKSSIHEEFEMWLDWEENNATLKREKSLTEDSVLARFGSEVNLNRTFFATKDGRIGVGSPKIRVEDEVWMLYGGRCLYAVRHGEETVDAEIAQMNAAMNIESEGNTDSRKKRGIFGGRRRSRDASESGSRKKSGFMGMGMNRRTSTDISNTMVVGSSGIRIGGTRPRPISGETAVSFDSTTSSPNKSSIYVKSGIMGRMEDELSGESNSTTPRARSPHNVRVYGGTSRQTRLFVGEAFVSGYMDCEAVSEVANGEFFDNWLVLI